VTVFPKAVIEQQLRGLDGSDQALSYGSWARRCQGEPGPLPQDVDLMVIGDAYDAMRIAVTAHMLSLGYRVRASGRVPPSMLVKS
jgi:hypothetical protein